MSQNLVGGRNLLHGPERPSDLLLLLLLHPCKQHKQDVLTEGPALGRPAAAFLQAQGQGNCCGQVEFLWQEDSWKLFAELASTLWAPVLLFCPFLTLPLLLSASLKPPGLG